MNGSGGPHTIDELLDRAIQAINAGDQVTANALAERVLAVDSDNPDAEDLLVAAEAIGADELRRMTIVFVDVVDSTALSTRIEPENYHTVISRYRHQVNEIIDRYEGHVFSTKGDGLLAVFGHPKAHENDVRRAVQAGLDITRDVAKLSERVHRRFGFEISVRVGVHRGLVYLDVGQDDVYGLGANLAARVSGLAKPGGVVVSEAIAPLVRGHFELEARPAQPVKGIDEPVGHYAVIGERTGRARMPLGPLVGRDPETAHLRASWALAERGALSAPGVCFSGEAGMGKSRLATAAADLAERSDNPVLALVGSPFQADAGLYPIRALLEERCGIERTTDQPDRLRLLRDEVRGLGLDPTAAVPALAPVLGISADCGYQPMRAAGTRLYRIIIDSIVDYLLACTGGGPAVVLAEDLQWCDQPTLDVVTSLLAADTGRLLVVLTGRNLCSLPGISNLTVFQLAPLTDDETDQLVTALDPTLSADERADVRRRCDGVPLYIEEVVTKVREQPPDLARWARVPDALYEPLFARLRASDTTIQVVEAAATIGREFDEAILRAVVDLNESDLDHAISDLKDVSVFEPVTVHRWRFRHELLREVAYELPPDSVRRTLHGRVADALVSGSNDPDWHLVARHYENAERFDEAADAYHRAAHDARCRGCLEEARSTLTRAIAQIQRTTPGPDRDRREVLLRLRRLFIASAVEGTFNTQNATDMERCLELAATDPRGSSLVATLTALWAYYMPSGDIRRLLRLSGSLRGKSSSGRFFHPTNAAAFGMAAWFQGDFRTARSVLEKATAAASVAELPDLESVWFIPNDPVTSMHIHLALARFIHGDLAGASEQVTQTLCRVADLDFPQGPFSHSYQRFYEIWMSVEAGRLDRAADTARELVADAERHGFEYWAMVGTIQQAVVDALSALVADGDDPAVLQGHVDTLTAIVQSLHAEEQKPKLFSPFYDAVLARLLTASGRAASARERLDATLGWSDHLGLSFYRAELLRLRADTAGDAAARSAGLRVALDAAREQNAMIFELRSAVGLFELDGKSARETLAETISHFPADSDWPELARARALLG